MKIDRQKEIERIGASFLLAILFHMVIFLLIEYGDLFVIEEYEGYIGPLSVGFEELLPTPVSTEVEEPGSDLEERQIEELTLEEAMSEDAVSKESLSDDSVVADATEPEIEAPPLEQSFPGIEEKTQEPSPIGDAATPPEHTETAEVSEESADTDLVLPEQSKLPSSESKPETLSPKANENERAQSDEIEALPQAIPQAIPFKDDSVHEGRDNITQFTIKMQEKSHIAKPAFRFQIRLPEWVEEEGIELELVIQFITGPDGQIIELDIIKSSGHDDVDNAVLFSMMPPGGNAWQFSKPPDEDRIIGKITYRINH